MGEISVNLKLLQQGQPPEDFFWLKAMTAGDELWLRPFREHYLENYIREGGSKVKILIGNEGSGKTHLLRFVAADAQELGYTVVFLNLREVKWKFSNMVELYKVVAAQVDRENLWQGLCRRVAAYLGYTTTEYDGSGSILPLLVEKGGLPLVIARKELRQAAANVLRGSDLGLPFLTFAYTLISARMGSQAPTDINIYWKWFSGEKLEAAERKQSRLYDRLTPQNARVWLYSLVRLLRLSGSAGIVILVDNMEVILERDPLSAKFLYTLNAAKDTYELIRQLIDDIDFLENFLLLLSGRRAVLTDEKRGIASYEALWMRVRSGLAPSPHFNPLADIVDVDKHLEEAGNEKFAQEICRRLQELLQGQGIERKFRDFPPLDDVSPLRRAVRETALMTDFKEA